MTKTVSFRVTTGSRRKRVRHQPGYRSSTIVSSELDKAPLQSRPWLARMEYLYRLSHLLPFHSQHYLKRMLGIAAMTTLRLDPSIKNTICRRCKCLLIPHQTARLSVRRHAPQLQCLNCEATCVLAQTKKFKTFHEAHRFPEKAETQSS